MRNEYPVIYLVIQILKKSKSYLGVFLGQAEAYSSVARLKKYRFISSLSQTWDVNVRPKPIHLVDQTSLNWAF